MHKFIAIVIAVLMTGCAAKTSRAPVVRPLAGHPGNIFLQSEDVTVSLPSGTEAQWEARDYDGKTIAHGLSMHRIRQRIHGRLVSWSEMMGQLQRYLSRSALHHELYRWGMVQY